MYFSIKHKAKKKEHIKINFKTEIYFKIKRCITGIGLKKYFSENFNSTFLFKENSNV